MAITTFDPAILASMEAEQAARVLVHHAADLQASDLFFLAHEKATNVSIRRLGVVQRVAMISRDQGRHLTSYFKAMAGMDLAEIRRPADGRWIMDDDQRTLDLRINCLPTLYGEDLALRIWDRRSGLRELSELGLSAGERTTLAAMLTSPSGLMLVTGPTGTGKTTTLYACLQFLNDGTRKINTLEDPIEYSIEGLRQSQVNTKIGLDFSDLLTGVLRQAPDVIMIGEIRDEDTASTAVRAANSGHLVLATLHAPTAAAAVQSMLALGAHPYYLASCLLGVVAQRLIRTLCPACRMNYDISGADTFKDIQHLLSEGEGQSIYGPTGCAECLEYGYIGRTGLFEIVTVNQEIRRQVAEAATTEQIHGAAKRNGMVQFRDGGMLKVAQGITSMEELLRDVPAEHLGLED